MVGAKGDDIGGSLLFAGPVASSREPERSAHLLSRRFPQPVGNNVHTFALNWSKGESETNYELEEILRVLYDALQFCNFLNNSKKIL